MKTIKNIKAKATKTATKIPAAETRAAVRPAKQKVKTAPAQSPARAKTEAPAKISRPTEPGSSRRQISTDLIAQRAYIIWEQQGRPPGHDLANWLLAESQLKQEQSFTA